MAKYLFLYRGAADEPTEPSAEDMQEEMQAWMSWIGDAMEAGWMVNSGEALLPEGKVVRGNSLVTDGPYAESKELVGGFSVVEAASLEHAAELSSGCPALSNGGSVEIRPIMLIEQ